jgi:TetR/AcrR family transcriptional regulator, regulator of cefoperazone and chloramphenicol sensitivity
MEPAERQLDTRQRLLDAAGEVFAEHGFRRATVREICRKANANIAAVNYHFGDKDRLYMEVLREAQRVAHAKYPVMLGLSPDAPAEQRLHAFVRSSLLRLLDPGRPAWHGVLLSREMVEPTAALDLLIQESVRPRFELLFTIVRELTGPDVPEERVRLCAQSVVGQCLYYYHGRHVITRLQPPEERVPLDVECLAEHITEFSLGAMRELTASARSVPI